MTIAGRRVLVRAVLTAIPTFAMTVLLMPKNFFKEIDKVRRRFLWAQEEELSGGKCKVNWTKVCSQLDREGLGVLNPERFDRALRQRWLWLSWKHPDRPWAGMEAPCSESDRLFFSAATSVTVGNGRTARFWICSWLQAGTLQLLFLALYKHSRRKNRTIADALRDDRWILDLAHGQTDQIVCDCVALARLLRSASLNLNTDTSDEIRWNLEASGCYTASSAYRAQFQANHTSAFTQIIWKTWAPGKLKVFYWLILLNRPWCNDRLQRRGWPNSYFCQLCFRNLETADHIFWPCPFTRTIWSSLSSWNGCAALSLQPGRDLPSGADRVMKIVEGTKPEFRKGIKSLTMLAVWEIWRHRNDCTFRNNKASMRNVLQAIRRGIDLWRQARATCLLHPFTLPPEGIG